MNIKDFCEKYKVHPQNESYLVACVENSTYASDLFVAISEQFLIQPAFQDVIDMRLSYYSHYSSS